MAYFPNGSAGECFDRQCSRCKYGDDACPIAAVQMSFNYQAVGNITATKILNELVDDEGNCSMFRMFKDFAAPAIHIAEPGTPLFDPSLQPPAPILPHQPETHQ